MVAEDLLMATVGAALAGAAGRAPRHKTSISVRHNQRFIMAFLLLRSLEMGKGAGYHPSLARKLARRGLYLPS